MSRPLYPSWAVFASDDDEEDDETSSSNSSRNFEDGEAGSRIS
jgi:hypothetical protein